VLEVIPIPFIPAAVPLPDVPTMVAPSQSPEVQNIPDIFKSNKKTLEEAAL
jgi:hypothetical protein